MHSPGVIHCQTAANQPTAASNLSLGAVSVPSFCTLLSSYSLMQLKHAETQARKRKFARTDCILLASVSSKGGIVRLILRNNGDYGRF